MFRVKLKESNESRNTTTTLADDSDLVVALEASTTYFVDCMFLFDANSVADCKWAWVYTGTLTRSLLYEGERDSFGTDPGGSGDALSPCYNYGNISAASRAAGGNNTASTIGGGHLRGVIVTNASGNLKLQWSQNNSDPGNTTIRAGSYISICKQTEMEGTLIAKTGDTSRTNNTLTADPDLQFVPKANKKYICEMFAIWDSASGAGDFQFRVQDTQVVLTAGHTTNLVLNTNNTYGAATESAVHGQWQDPTFISAAATNPVSTSTAANKSYVYPWWSHQMGGSDGAFAFEWSQFASNATPTIVRAPSWLWYQEINQP